MLPNGHPRIRPAEFTYAAGHVEAEHAHDEHQLVYASYGLLCVDTASSRWVVPPLRAVWVPAQTPHIVTAKADSRMSTLYVDSEIRLPDLGRVTVVSVSALLRELILHIIDTPPVGSARDHLEGVIFDQLSAAHAAPLELPRTTDPRIRAIADALEQDPCDRRTLREFGTAVGASDRTLQRLFATEVGTTFGRWRTQLRLQHAVIELGTGSSVTNAALRCGYREVSAFIEAFRHAFGTTPGRYFSDMPGPTSEVSPK